MQPHTASPLHTSSSGRSSDIADLNLELLELLLDLGILRGHLFVLGLPGIPLGLEGLDFTLEMSRLDIGLTKPIVPNC